MEQIEKGTALGETVEGLRAKYPGSLYCEPLPFWAKAVLCLPICCCLTNYRNTVVLIEHTLAM